MLLSRVSSLQLKFKKDTIEASFIDDGAQHYLTITHDELGLELEPDYDSANGLYVPILKTELDRDDNGQLHSYVEQHDVWISVYDYVAEAIEANSDGRPDELKEIYNAVDTIIERILSLENA